MKINIYFIKISIITFFVAIFHVYAEDTPEETVENYQKLTPSFFKEEMYGAMKNVPQNTTNNLRRKTGSPFYAKGVPLVIEGHIYDISGLPIKDVTVKITQANHYGSYNFIIQPNSAVHDPNFLSTGTAITNNLGYYSFVTIMPGYYGNRAPHIHVNVKHKMFEFETEMFFANHQRNAVDKKFQKLKKLAKQAVTANVYYIDRTDFSLGLHAEFDIYVNYSFKI